MEPRKHEIDEKRIIRWLMIAVLALAVLVLGLYAWRLLFPPADRLQAADAQADPPDAVEPTAVSPGKAAMIEDVRALNSALSFDALAALTAEELEQLCATGAPGLPIGISQAAQLAEEYAGTLAVDSVTWDVDPELDDSPAHYEVELHHITQGDFEYKIDAYTGQVLEGQPDILQIAYVPASGGAEETAPAAPAPSGGTSNAAHVPQASGPAAQQPASAQQPEASGEQSGQTGEEAAKAAAFAHAGVEASDASNIQVKADWEDGVKVYDVEFRANGVEYDYEVEAATGTVLKSEQEWGGASGASQPSGGAQTRLIGEEAAKTAALSHAGVQPQDVGYIRWELDRDDGVQAYEIEFVSGGVEYDYEIDAVSGVVLKAEQERAD